MQLLTAAAEQEQCEESKASWVEAISSTLSIEPNNLYYNMMDAIKKEEVHYKTFINNFNVSQVSPAGRLCSCSSIPGTDFVCAECSCVGDGTGSDGCFRYDPFAHAARIPVVTCAMAHAGVKRDDLAALQLISGIDKDELLVPADNYHQRDHAI